MYSKYSPVLSVLLVLVGTPALAAIARDGTCAAATTSCTFTATATSSMKIIFAFDNGNSVIPTLPAGWTSIDSGIATSGAQKVAFRIGCNVSSSGADTGSGTWTSATHVTGGSYSGTGATTTANCNTMGIGAVAHNGATGSATVDFPTISMVWTDGTSWVAAGEGTSTTLCTPTNMTREASSTLISWNDTNAVASSWPDTTCAITSGNWESVVVEIMTPHSGPASSIARNGTCAASATSCTFSATATGSLKIIFAYTNGGTIPTLPAGWTSVDSNAVTTTSAFRIGCNVSTGSGDTGSGTWTSATLVVGASYSGTNVGTTANCNTTGIGQFAHTGVAGGTTYDYPALTLNNGGSWVVGMAGSSALVPCTPTLMSQFTSIGTGPAGAGSDTTKSVSSWADRSCIVATSGNLETVVVEILNTGSVTATTPQRSLMGVGT